MSLRDEGPLTSQRSYLDHNATTPLHPLARAAMLAACDVAGNPSSIHAEGRAARAVIDKARREVAGLTGAQVDNVFFTSGGTEALNMVLTPELQLSGRSQRRLLVGAGEHPAVLSGHRFGDTVEIVPLLPDGRLDLDALATCLDGEPAMLAIQAANNETGVVQPVRAAADLVHGAGGYVVCDAVQAAGKIACDINAFGADALAISAHKFGGPKGVGALCFAGTDHHLGRGVVRGGGQERGLRAGTENIVGIAGMGAACAPAAQRCTAERMKLAAWRDEIEAIVIATVPDAVIFGMTAQRLPNTSCFAVPGLDAQTLLMNLDLSGVAASAGSACAAGKVKVSHVLRAMGVDEQLAARMLRVSLGWTTTEQDVELFAHAFARAARTMRPRVAA